MPLFEFICQDCQRRFTALVGMIADGAAPPCPKCNSTNLQKAVSRFATPRSEDQFLDDMADPDKLGDIDDPRTMRKWMREMSRDMDEDADELEELMEAAHDEEVADEGGSGD